VWLQRQPIEEHETVIQLKVHALEGLINRGRTEIAWARRGLQLCDQIDARRARTTGERASG
jgi:hypothetical protein